MIDSGIEEEFREIIEEGLNGLEKYMNYWVIYCYFRFAF